MQATRHGQILKPIAVQLIEVSSGNQINPFSSTDGRTKSLDLAYATVQKRISTA